EISRGGQQVPPPLIAMFSLPEGRARVVPGDNGAGWFIVVHEHRVPGDAATNAALVQTMRQQLNAGGSEELAQQFARAIELHSDVSRNEDAIRSARQALTASTAPPPS